MIHRCWLRGCRRRWVYLVVFRKTRSPSCFKQNLAVMSCLFIMAERKTRECNSGARACQLADTAKHLQFEDTVVYGQGSIRQHAFKNRHCILSALLESQRTRELYRPVEWLGQRRKLHRAKNGLNPKRIYVDFVS